MIRINDSYLTHAIDYASYASKIAEINQSIDQKPAKEATSLAGPIIRKLTTRKNLPASKKTANTSTTIMIAWSSVASVAAI